MANLGFAFDPNAVPESEFAAIPAGEYPAVIVDSDMKPTKSGTGKYLELVHQVIDGPYKGKKVWSRLNLINSNAQAVQIAQQNLAEIQRAIGLVQTISDSQLLHNRPCVIRVEFVPSDIAKGRKSDSNEIKAWKSIGGAAPMNAAPPMAAANAAPAAAAPPWGRK